MLEYIYLKKKKLKKKIKKKKKNVDTWMSTMLKILHFRCSISYFKRQFCIDENLNIRQISAHFF